MLKRLRVKLLGYAKPSRLDLPLEFGNRIRPPHRRHFPLLVACQSMRAPSPSAGTLSPRKVSVSPSADSKAHADWKPAQICSPDTFL
ncbi:sphingomyelin phosphodiesterase 3-like protein [Labeo rohita]|uniref:Sphingomyelin phosphodiesterase 3-like protein n=1 Tax=Labeo rohita TaxID=84645 RepID=A0A498NIT2_LABRO|nr:sphingomyelin phosphodiesterase 3-like protein [Labeo rohita]